MNAQRLVLILIVSFALQMGLNAACSLANPSFEIAGSGVAVFGGWENFGSAGSTITAFHGSRAASLSGQNTGSENVSGFWQQMDSSPDEQWQISGHLMIPSDMPLLGESSALVNVEWRSSSGGMISYESFSVADAASPWGEYISFEEISSPAPAGTVAIRLVLAIRQAAGAPSPRVVYDQITCYSTSFPTIDDVQWNDFPGNRSIDWSGRTWRVKGPGFYGPGPNNFSDSPSSVWVDAEDRLHMTIRQINDAWHSTEVTLVDALGYGDYIFTTVGAIDQIDLRTVLGLFLWQYSTCWEPADTWWNPYNEFDIEYSRWGSPGNQIGQFVAQPWDWQGNIFRYGAAFGENEISSHAFRWLPDRIESRAWRGGTEDESPASLISSWIYTGPHIPRPEQPRVHINLWYFGAPPSVQQEVVLDSFTFVPHGTVEVSEDTTTAPQLSKLAQNHPNPFRRQTTISYTLHRQELVILEVFDIRGRRVASLHSGIKAAGSHSLNWDAEGFPSGVYIYRLQTGGESIARKLLLLK